MGMTLVGNIRDDPEFEAEVEQELAEKQSISGLSAALAALVKTPTSDLAVILGETFAFKNEVLPALTADPNDEGTFVINNLSAISPDVADEGTFLIGVNV
jgi:hypothetical protein